VQQVESERLAVLHPISCRDFTTSLAFLVVLVFLTMAGSEEEDHSLHQSPCTRGIIQHFERHVQRHIEGLDNDMQVTNDKIGQLEATQIATNTKLTGLETAVGNIDKSLAALLRRFDELHAKTNKQRDDWEDEYIADTE
jgi:hypothetical protein